uniref:Uncharacterized protein n=1 Tax=Ciona intestinalis TaxID=7719 RepID=H2XTL1_CIOIN
MPMNLGSLDRENDRSRSTGCRTTSSDCDVIAGDCNEISDTDEAAESRFVV